MRTTIKDSSGAGVCLFHVLSNVSTTQINLRGKSDARTKQIQCLGPRCVWFFFFFMGSEVSKKKICHSPFKFLHPMFLLKVYVG